MNPEVTLTTERAPRRKVAPTLSSAVFALVVAVWIHPAFSATGTNARCDHSIDDPPASVPDDGSLALRVLGHTANAAGSSEQSSPVETGAVSVPTPDLIPVEPRVDAVLRSTSRERLASRLQPEESGDRGVPLVADQAEGAEEPPRILDSRKTESAAQSSAYPNDDLVRYLQRQMYRTDI
jgi:hypothetical protein